MSEQPKQRQPWERCKGETRKAYEAFCAYRDMGVTRSLAAAGRSLGKSTPLMEQWSVKWGWVDRVAAYEDYQEAIRQKVADDVAIQVAIKAAEENARQATLRVDENRHLRTLGRAVALRILQVIGQGALGEMGLRKVKKVNQTTAKDGSFERDETEIKSVFELAGLAVQAIEIGQKLERLDAGKPTDITQGDGDTAQVIELARKALELLENEHVRNAS